MSLNHIKPITKAAQQRAKAADPNGQRCLIENYSKNRAVHLAHVVFRDASGYNEIVSYRCTSANLRAELYTKQMESLEWSWKMAKGTLNLDTQENVFFCK